MSLIFGISLSDRVYLTGDTRLTITQNGEAKYSDDIMKVVPLGNNNEALIAAAGDLKLTQFILQDLVNNHIGVNLINAAEFRANIKDWISHTIDNYLSEGNPYAKAAFIISIVDSQKKKVIDGKQLMREVKVLQDKKNVPMNMKPVIFDALYSKPNVPNPYPELKVNDIILFGIEIDTQQESIIVDASWGEYVIYAPRQGLAIQNVPDTFFPQLEFELGAGRVDHDTALLVALIKTLEKDLSLDTVGGSILTLMLSPENEIYLYEGTVNRLKSLEPFTFEEHSTISSDGNKIYTKSESGEKKELIPFFEYPLIGQMNI